MVADFIEWVKNLNLSNIYDSSDGALTNYISKSVYRLFLRRLCSTIEKEPRYIYFEDMTPTQKNDLLKHTAVSDELPLSQVLPQGILSEAELNILTAIYEDGESVTGIARKLNVSRQNINQIKKRAEQKLRENLK